MRLLVFHCAGDRAAATRRSALEEEVRRVVACALGERGVSLIVMCSRRRPLRAALLGSTAESVYRTAPCPILVARPLKPMIRTPPAAARHAVACEIR